VAFFIQASFMFFFTPFHHLLRFFSTPWPLHPWKKVLASGDLFEKRQTHNPEEHAQAR